MMANSHSTGCVQSMRRVGAGVVLVVSVVVMAIVSASPIYPLMVRRRVAPSRTMRSQRGLILRDARKGALLRMREILSHPKQLRIARLDLLALRLDAGRILFHQLDVGQFPPSRL